MITRILLFLVVTLLSCPNSLVHAQREQSTLAGSNGAPGEGDIAIMQKEIKWGMQEMQRYKMLKGEWPVRPVAATEEKVVDHFPKRSSSADEASTSHHHHRMRGHHKPKDTAHINYWDLLVSVF